MDTHRSEAKSPRSGRPRAALLAAAAVLLAAIVLPATTVLAQPAETPEPDAASGGAPATPDTAAPAPPAPPPASSPEDAALEEAKSLFRQGNELRKAGDFERALDYYMRSRALKASPHNTTNAAICLSRIGRHDEALELYEVLLTEFGAKMGAERRTAVGRAMTQLRGQVGSIDVQANVEGSIVVDGRARGAVPLVHPVRVMPGKHEVQVLADGYRGFSKSVEVAVGQTATIRAKLEPLTVAGRMRIEDPGLAGAEVFVDGAKVGAAPWEGTLAPGEHYFFVRRDQHGSAPQQVVVVKGQAIVVTAPLLPLGPELKLTTKPPSAELLIGGVAVGKSWQGRLPEGEFQLLAREDGYVDAKRTLVVKTGMSTDVTLTLAVDESHPRWGVDTGRFWVDAFGGPVIAPSLGTGVEQSCDSYECDQGVGVGFFAGAVGGYEFPVRLSLQFAAGYLMARKEVDRSYSEPKLPGPTGPRMVRYDVADVSSYAGPFVAAGLGYRLPFADIAELRADVLAGAHFVFANHDASASLSAEGRTLDGLVVGADQTVRSANLLIMPHAEIGFRFGGFGLGLGLAAAILATSGPEFAPEDIQPRDVVCDNPPDPEPLECTAGSHGAQPGKAYGPMVMLLPRLTLGYLFE